MNNQTYKMMAKVAELVEETKEEELLEMYENGQENQAIAKFFVMNYGLITKNSNKYISIEQDVADSIALQSLDVAFKEFKSNKQTQLNTFFIRIYKRKLINYYKKIKADKRTLDRDSNSIEAITEATEGNFGVTYEDNNIYYENEIEFDFYELDFLTPNEKKILTEFNKCGFKATQSDIADRLDVHESSISRAINRLSDKLPQLKEELFS